MIARLWRASAAREKANDYVEHFQRSVFPELIHIDGYRGAYVMQRDLNETVFARRNPLIAQTSCPMSLTFQESKKSHAKTQRLAKKIYNDSGTH